MVDAKRLEPTASVLGLATILAGITISLSVFLVTGLSNRQYGLPITIAACAAAAICWFGIACFTGYLGATRRLTTAQLTKQLLGREIGWILNLASCLSLLGWFSINNWALAKACFEATELAGWRLPFPLVCLACGLLTFSTAYLGFRGLQSLSIVVIPLLSVIFIHLAIFRWPLARQSFAFESIEWRHFPDAFTMMFGSFILGAVVFPDIARFQRQVSDVWKTALLGFAIVVPGISCLAAIAVVGYDADTTLSQMVGAAGLSGFGLPVVVLAIWTTNDNNLYSGSLALEAQLPMFSHQTICSVLTTAGVMLSMLDIQAILSPFLQGLGIAVGPMGGLLASRTLTLRFAKDHQHPPGRRIFAAYATAVALGLAAAYGPLQGFFFGTPPSVCSMLAAFSCDLLLEVISRWMSD